MLATNDISLYSSRLIGLSVLGLTKLYIFFPKFTLTITNFSIVHLTSSITSLTSKTLSSNPLLIMKADWVISIMFGRIPFDQLDRTLEIILYMLATNDISVYSSRPIGLSVLGIISIMFGITLFDQLDRTLEMILYMLVTHDIILYSSRPIGLSVLGIKVIHKHYTFSITTLI